MLDGVVEHVKEQLDSSVSWVVSGLSGGCVTAVRIAARFVGFGDCVLGIVVDSGVPGIGEAVYLREVPVVIYYFSLPEDEEGRRKEFWNNGQVVVEWKRRCYNVVHSERYTSPGHASHLSFELLGKCVNWFWWHGCSDCLA